MELNSFTLIQQIETVTTANAALLNALEAVYGDLSKWPVGIIARLSTIGLSPDCGCSYIITTDKPEELDENLEYDNEEFFADSMPEVDWPRLKMHMWTSKDVRYVLDQSNREVSETTGQSLDEEQLEALLGSSVAANLVLLKSIETIDSCRSDEIAEILAEDLSKLDDILRERGLLPNGPCALTIVGNEQATKGIEAWGQEPSVTRLRLHTWISKQVQVSCVSPDNWCEGGTTRVPWDK